MKFHNGEDFTADDVVFSYQRALAPTSDYKGYLAITKETVKVDDLTVQIKTKGPNPLVADNLTSVFIMSKKWAEANNATKPQDFKNKEENFAVRNANGTGPFVLVSREPDVKTVVKRNEAYWGRREVPLEITELVLTTIKQDATRVAALLSGEVDVVQDVPVQDIERLKGSPNLRVTEGPENRTIFFGFDVGSAELASSDVKGKNPFADVRVRQAVNIAINRQAIQRVVMRGQAVPAGSIVAAVRQRLQEGVRQHIPPVDIAKAKACSPRPAIRTASRSRCIARTTAISTTRRSARRRSACSGRSASRSTWFAVEVAALPDAAEPASPTSICSAGACRPTTATTSSAISITRAPAPMAAGTRRAIPIPKWTS